MHEPLDESLTVKEQWELDTLTGQSVKDLQATIRRQYFVNRRLTRLYHDASREERKLKRKHAIAAKALAKETKENYRLMVKLIDAAEYVNGCMLLLHDTQTMEEEQATIEARRLLFNLFNIKNLSSFSGDSLDSRLVSANSYI